MSKKQYFYYDENSEMVLVDSFKPWLDNGYGDALWRTSLAYIAYGSRKYYRGIVKAFRMEGGGKYQIYRCNDPLIGKDDVSRDQVIMAFVALFLNKDEATLKAFVKHTPYRLSKRFTMTPTMWIWARGLTGNKIMAYIAQVLQLLELSVSCVWNKVIKLLIGWKELTQQEIHDGNELLYEEMRNGVLNTTFKKLLWKAEFPGYGLHLAAWFNYVSPNTWIKKIINKLLIIDADSKNLLIHALAGKEIDYEYLHNYKHQEEWRWSSRMNAMSRASLLPEGYKQEGLDVDIVNYVLTQ